MNRPLASSSEHWVVSYLEFIKKNQKDLYRGENEENNYRELKFFKGSHGCFWIKWKGTRVKEAPFAGARLKMSVNRFL